MNGIVINIDPVILHVGMFELRWYSLTIMLAVIAAVVIARRRAISRGFVIDDLYSATIWMVLGGVIGARLFHVIDHWSYYSTDPSMIFQIQQGGLAIWGALAGGTAATVIFARIKHMPLKRIGDVMAPALLVGQIIGRLGCIVNGDAYGGVTSLPWGFIYIHPDAMIPASLVGVPTHPYPVYEMLWNGMALLVILKLERHFKQDGLLFLAYVEFYSLARFVLTFVRQETITVGGLQQAQVVALVVFFISLGMIIYKMTRRDTTEEMPNSIPETGADKENP